MLSDIAPDDVKIDWIIDEKNRMEYYLTVSKGGTEQDYFVKQWTEEVAGKQVWKFNIFEIKPDGVIASSDPIGKDSYYWFDKSGVHMHFGQKDKDLIKSSGEETATLIISIIAAAAIKLKNPHLALGAASAFVFAKALSIVINVVDYGESNDDGSIDVFISWTNCLLIPIYVVEKDLQTIEVKIGSHNYPVFV